MNYTRPTRTHGTRGERSTERLWFFTDRVRTMDAAWAVVAGSLIGAVGTLGGSTLATFLSDRRSKDQIQRERLRDAVEGVLTGLVRYSGEVRRSPDKLDEQKAAAGDSYFAATSRLALLLRRGEGEVDAVLLGTFVAITVAPQLAFSLTADMTQRLSAWYRGDMSMAAFSKIRAEWPDDAMETRFNAMRQDEASSAQG